MGQGLVGLVRFAVLPLYGSLQYWSPFLHPVGRTSLYVRSASGGPIPLHYPQVTLDIMLLPSVKQVLSKHSLSQRVTVTHEFRHT